MGVNKKTKTALKISAVFFLFVSFAFTQKNPPFTFCGKQGDCSFTYDEFLKCEKKLITTDSKTFVNSFMVTVQKKEKKETYSIQYKSKGNTFSKDVIESMEKLYKSKKLGNTVLIEDVEIIQSGQAAKKDAGITITLN